MISPARLSLALSLCFVAACGKGDDTADETGGESSSDTTTSSSTDTTGDATTETGGEPIACGDIECAGNQACLTFPQEPMCTDNPDGAPCPRGTSESLCGGAGLACCCEPPPPTIYECVDPACEGPVDCACLVEECIPMCTATATPGVFNCEAPLPP